MLLALYTSLPSSQISHFRSLSSSMEGTVIPNRPAYTPSNQPPPTKQLKFNSATLPPPAKSSSPRLPLDSILQQLSSPPPNARKSKSAENGRNPSLHISTQKKTHLKKPFSAVAPQLEEGDELEDWPLRSLSHKGKLMFNSIVEVPLSGLSSFLGNARSELLKIDLFGMLKALYLSDNWEKAIFLFEWYISNLSTDNTKLDHQVVELMVQILGSKSQYWVALRLFDVIPIEEYSLDIRAYTTIIHTFSRTGKYERAISLFEKVKEMGLSPTLVTYNVVLDAYGKMGRSWHKIVDLLDEMRGRELVFDEFTFSTVISACGREGMVEEAKEFFADLKAQGYVPGTVTYNSIMQVFGKAGMYSEALSILEEMEANNCSPDIVTYNELVGAYAKAGLCEEAASVVDTMNSKGVAPNDVTYATVVHAYGQAGEVNKAFDFFNQMKSLGSVPNVPLYNTILVILAKKSRFEDMMKVIYDMKINGCAPDRITWNTMISMCGSMGGPANVNRVLQEMKSCGFEPDKDTFNTLIGVYGRFRSRTDIMKMYAHMINSGFAPCMKTYNALLNALARRGDFRAVESVVLEMRSKGFKPNETSYALMINSYAQGRNLKGIARIERHIYGGHIFSSWVLLRTLILANFKCRALSGMERAFQQLKKHGYKPDLVVYNLMLSIYAKKQMQGQAHEMLLSIQENGLQPDLVTYNSLMDMYASGGECWKAEEVLKTLEKSGKADIVSYNTVIKGFCRQGLLDEAMRIFLEMRTRGVAPCIFTYNTFVSAYARREMFGEVEDVINYMIEHKCKPDELTYLLVIDAYCRLGRSDEAMEFLSRIKVKDHSLDDRCMQMLTSRVWRKVETK